MDKVPVSVVVIAKNEEKRLADCLKSAAFAAELIVLDDNSTDGTVRIAESFGAKVTRRAMDIEGRHRNFAYSLATQSWVFSLDADERITPELAAEITRVAQTPNDPHTCYCMPVKTFIGTDWIKGGGYYPAPKTRFFKRGQFKYEEARVHPKMFYEGTCGQLRGDILHYSSPSWDVWFSKFNRETALEAEKWLKDGRKVGPWRVFRKACSRFLKYYFQKDGITTGYTGFLMSFLHAAYQIITFAKYRELKNVQGPAK
ncbi:MAG: glycosyltransferase family 2 protein [Candidatus Omnitrophica bacterium]|nr:glycosyltransferase family 2 protein [Candidatus Omnitrophota bacterium]